MTKQEAKELYEHYDKYISELKKAQIELISGGVQSYTIGGRSLTRFDLEKIDSMLENAIKKRSEYAAIMNGKRTRKAVAVIPRDY